VADIASSGSGRTEEVGPRPRPERFLHRRPSAGAVEPGRHRLAQPRDGPTAIGTSLTASDPWTASRRCSTSRTCPTTCSTSVCRSYSRPTTNTGQVRGVNHEAAWSTSSDDLFVRVIPPLTGLPTLPRERTCSSVDQPVSAQHPSPKPTPPSSGRSPGNAWDSTTARSVRSYTINSAVAVHIDSHRVQGRV
jgi:hypothetical protein